MIIEWIFRPELRSQLPLLLIFFSRCGQLYFKITKNDYFKGGRRLFLIISSINKSLFGVNYLNIRLPEYEICVDLTDPRFLNVINELLKEKSDTGVLNSLLKEGDTFIDIGANQGSFSIVASRLVGESGRVIAIEAQPRLVYAIKKSLELNALCPYDVFQTAVGDYDGVIEFLIPTDTSGTAGVFYAHSARHHYKTIRIPIVKFDNLIEWHNLLGNVILKLDIEGSEYAFLKGAKEMISNSKPIILMEINPESIHAANITGDILLNTLMDLGYQFFAELNSPGNRLSICKLNMTSFRNVILYR
jgi:FkbM family methyltransferase